jgi:prevent-host-death family protein
LTASIKIRILRIMQRISATALARNFGEVLGKVEHGRSVQVIKHGRAIARIVPDSDFMPGKIAADIFQDHRGDAATAAAVAKEIAKLNQEEDDALAH